MVAFPRRLRIVRFRQPSPLRAWARGGADGGGGALTPRWGGGEDRNTDVTNADEDGQCQHPGPSSSHQTTLPV